MKQFVRSIRNFFAVIVGGMVFASTASLANPVAWTAPGGNFAGQYCYDFGGYVPAVDSPVTGGWIAIGGAFSPYGVVCVNMIYGGALDPYGWSNINTAYKNSRFYRDTRAPSGGIYFSVGVASDCSDPYNPCTNYFVGKTELSCPKNRATIGVGGYTRSDGVTNHAPLGAYSFTGGSTYCIDCMLAIKNTYALNLVASGGNYVSTSAARSHVACVKTDTSQ